MTDLDISILDALHTKPIPNPTQKQVEDYIEKQNRRLSPEELDKRNQKCVDYFIKLFNYERNKIK